MAAKTPLNDNDRMPWLEKLSSFALNELSYNDNVVVACSALKVIYRNVFRQAVAECPSFTVQLHFLYLQLDEQATMARVGSRKGHFMPAALVRSQYEALEEPTEEELGLDCMVLNSRNSSTKLKMMSLEAVSAWLGQ
jgi:gluconokinase